MTREHLIDANAPALLKLLQRVAAGSITPEEAVDVIVWTWPSAVEKEDKVSDHLTVSELKDYKPRWTAEGIDYEANWDIRPDHLTIGADRLRGAAINAAWVQMRNHLPPERWSTEVCDAIVEATLRTVRDWVEAP